MGTATITAIESKLDTTSIEAALLSRVKTSDTVVAVPATSNKVVFVIYNTV